MPVPRRVPPALSWLGKLWTSPNTLLGLALGALGLPFGARFGRGDNAVNVLDHPLLSLTRVHAITFGNAVLYRRGVRPEHEARRYDGAGAQRLADHERAHTLQYEIWGPFFLPAYLLLALLPGTHRLERQADRWAQRRHGARPEI
jgi:hypothetical protein